MEAEELKTEMTEKQTAEVEPETRLWSSGGNIEALLGFMRHMGLSQPRSVDALVKVTGIAAKLLNWRCWGAQPGKISTKEIS